MELSDQEKLKLGLESIKAFIEQFPNDFNAKIVMEVLWDEILNYNSEQSQLPTTLKGRGL
jgi:hypothetical protein